MYICTSTASTKTFSIIVRGEDFGFAIEPLLVRIWQLTPFLVASLGLLMGLVKHLGGKQKPMSIEATQKENQNRLHTLMFYNKPMISNPANGTDSVP